MLLYGDRRMAKHHIPLKLDKTALSIGSLSDTSEERTYWLTQTPRERLKQIEILRRINYGNRATRRLQRVLEVAQRTWR